MPTAEGRGVTINGGNAMNEIIKYLRDLLNFYQLDPEDMDVEYNCGTIWMTDRITGKSYCLTMGECENEEEG